MQRFAVGDRVRVDIPDASDPDHDRFHGRHGTVVGITEDDASAETGDARDALLYRIEFDGGEAADFRWRDIRPPIEG